MASDNRTVSDIVENPENPPEDSEEPDEATLENVQVEVERGTFNLTAGERGSAVKYAPPIAQRREEADIPPQMSVKDLVGVNFIVVDKVKQKAALPDTGEMREGYQCLCVHVETEKTFTVWIGQVALMRDLSAVNLPFRATISKRGRTWQFS